MNGSTSGENNYNPKGIPSSNTYTIQSGDTLNDIASRYGTTVETLARENNISDVNKIIAGNSLVVPMETVDLTQFTDPVPTASDIHQADSGIVGNTYVVQPGDTLNNLAVQYGISVDAIAEANNIQNVNMIMAGQQLIIPGAETTSQIVSEDMAKSPLTMDFSTPEELASEIETLIIPEVDGPIASTTSLNGQYTGVLHSKSIASESSRSTNGILTFDNKKYTIGSVTNGDTISQSDYTYLIGQVAGEGGLDCDDMLGVCCTILNRVEAGGDFGSNVQEALQKGYWPWGKTCDKYLNYDAYGNPSLKTLDQLGAAEFNKLMDAQKVVNDAMNGIRNVNSDTKYYGGDGIHNYFSDNV